MARKTMKSDITPVTFSNSDGLRLFGMLHRPVPVTKSCPAILLLSPGVKMRVGPHRMYNKMADRFVQLGYSVLRFDFYGLGDSEGEVTEQYLADLYGGVQAGRYVNDTVSAMNWMRTQFGTSEFIAAGLCGGALTGLLTAAQDDRIVALLGLSIPVILDGSNIDFGKYMTQAQLKGMRNSYFSKIVGPDAWRSWIRFLTCQSDYRVIFRSIVKPLMESISPIAHRPSGSRPSTVSDNTNPFFSPAFRHMVASSRPVLLLFAEMDRLYWEFQKKFEDRHRDELASFSEYYEVHLVKQANHIFSFLEWETEMLDISCRWLRRLQERKGDVAMCSSVGGL